MEDMELKIYQFEIHKQCEFALVSVNYMNEALRNLGSKNGNTQLWFFVQSFLVSSANVSKLLWGSGRNAEKTAERRKDLRKSLQIDENSMLKNTRFRNHFEHFDERIENWASSSERKNFIDSNIGPGNMIVGVNEEDFLRNFDTDTMTIKFKGDTFEIQPIVDELVKLVRVAELEKNKWGGF